MKNFLKRIKNDISQGENIDLIATVILAFLITILSLLGIASDQIVPSLTLATLGLLATGILVTRYKIDTLSNACNNEDIVHFSNQKPIGLDKDLEISKEIWMMGLILRNTTLGNFYNFKSNVSNGTKIRALILNPEKIDLDDIVHRFSRAATKDQIRSTIELTINQFSEIRNAANHSENVKLHLIDFVPSYSIYIFPSIEGKGHLYVEIYGYKSKHGSIPKFKITEKENIEWYRFFIDQYDLMWNDSEDGLS